MGEIHNFVTTTYRADTAQAKANVQSLRGVEREHAKEVLEGLNAHNEKLEQSLKTWEKYAVTVGVAGLAIEAAKKAWEVFAESTKLETASAGANIDLLAEAVHGLVDEEHLMNFAAKAMHGTWKLNQVQMETVLHGALALRKTMGFELQPTIDALTVSISKGNTRALKEFGITATDKMGVLRQLDSIYASLHGNADLAGDSMAAAGVQMKNSFHEMVVELGRFVNALEPVVSAIAGVTKKAADGMDAMSSWDKFGHALLYSGNMPLIESDLGPVLRKAGYDLAMAQIERAEEERRAARAAKADAANEEGRFAFRRAMELKGNFEKGTAPESKKAGEFRLKGVIDMTDAPIIYGNSEFKDLPALNAYLYGQSKMKLIEKIDFEGDAARQAFQHTSQEEKDAEWRHDMAEQHRHDLEDIAAAREKLMSQDMEQVFGVPAQFDAHRASIEALAGAFNVLENASVAAYDALISGSGSAATAFKKAIADGIAAMGKEFLVKGLGEAAMALGSLAIGNYGSAATHGEAAAAYFAGAAAAGVAASALGYGGGRGSGGGGPRASSGARDGGATGGGRGAEVNRNVTIILGAGYDELTPRQRDAMLARAVTRGMQAEQSTTMRMGR